MKISLPWLFISLACLSVSIPVSAQELRCEGKLLAIQRQGRSFAEKILTPKTDAAKGLTNFSIRKAAATPDGSATSYLNTTLSSSDFEDATFRSSFSLLIYDATSAESPPGSHTLGFIAHRNPPTAGLRFPLSERDMRQLAIQGNLLEAYIPFDPSANELSWYQTLPSAKLRDYLALQILCKRSGNK